MKDHNLSQQSKLPGQSVIPLQQRVFSCDGADVEIEPGPNHGHPIRIAERPNDFHIPLGSEVLENESTGQSVNPLHQRFFP